jgi:hypothetical protein
MCVLAGSFGKSKTLQKKRAREREKFTYSGLKTGRGKEGRTKGRSRNMKKR